MDFPVAVGGQKNAVFMPVGASFGSPHDVMVVPSRQRGDLLVAHRAYASLFFPEPDQLPAAYQGVGHLYTSAVLEVLFPVRVVGVGGSLDFDMPFDGHTCCGEEPDR